LFQIPNPWTGASTSFAFDCTASAIVYQDCTVNTNEPYPFQSPTKVTINITGPNREYIGNDQKTLSKEENREADNIYQWIYHKLPLSTGIVKGDHHNLYFIYGGKDWGISDGWTIGSTTANSSTTFDCWYNATASIPLLGP